MEEGIFRQCLIQAEKVSQSRLPIPLAKDEPLAARFDDSVADVHQEQGVIVGLLACGRKTGAPKGIEVQPLPNDEEQPTRSPLPGPVDLQTLQIDLNQLRVGREFFRTAILREEGNLSRPLVALLESLDHAAPDLPLAVVDLAKVEDLPLRRASVGQAVFLAVLDPPVALQIHGRHDTGSHRAEKGQGLPHKPLRTPPPGKILADYHSPPGRTFSRPRRIVKVGLKQTDEQIHLLSSLVVADDNVFYHRIELC